MQHFKALIEQFAAYFNTNHFPEFPANLYAPCDYFLELGGKRIRPVLCLMGNDLFDEIVPEAYHAATAIELFHNFTLIHDDMMDAAALRRGKQTVHTRFGSNIALLSGDVMLIRAYEYLSKIDAKNLKPILELFNTTARQVCEGQQLDMDFEQRDTVAFDEYVTMIGLKTSVLLAASLQIGGILGGAGEANLHHLYQFGYNLGIAFQIQDDYLDAFGNPETFGKEVGGDIRQNKKTFLLIHALETASDSQKSHLNHLLQINSDTKVAEVLNIFADIKIDAWAHELKLSYLAKAYEHLEAIAVTSSRKQALHELAAYLISRDR